MTEFDALLQEWMDVIPNPQDFMILEAVEVIKTVAADFRSAWKAQGSGSGDEQSRLSRLKLREMQEQQFADAVTAMTGGQVQLRMLRDARAIGLVALAPDESLRLPRFPSVSFAADAPVAALAWAHFQDQLLDYLRILDGLLVYEVVPVDHFDPFQRLGVGTPVAVLMQSARAHAHWPRLLWLGTTFVRQRVAMAMWSLAEQSVEGEVRAILDNVDRSRPFFTAFATLGQRYRYLVSGSSFARITAGSTVDAKSLWSLVAADLQNKTESDPDVEIVAAFGGDQFVQWMAVGQERREQLWSIARAQQGSDGDAALQVEAVIRLLDSAAVLLARWSCENATPLFGETYEVEDDVSLVDSTALWADTAAAIAMSPDAMVIPTWGMITPLGQTDECAPLLLNGLPLGVAGAPIMLHGRPSQIAQALQHWVGTWCDVVDDLRDFIHSYQWWNEGQSSARLGQEIPTLSEIRQLLPRRLAGPDISLFEQIQNALILARSDILILRRQQLGEILGNASVIAARNAGVDLYPDVRERLESFGPVLLSEMERNNGHTRADWLSETFDDVVNMLHVPLDVQRWLMAIPTAITEKNVETNRTELR